MKIHSIFLSLDGEVNHWGQGMPSVFVRLQGCNLHCSYCDVPGAQEQKDDNYTVDQVFEIIRGYGCTKVTITGGEPLLQEDEIHQLLNRLFPHNYHISIETNGTLSTHRFRDSVRSYDRISLVVDYKLMPSGPAPWPVMSPHAFSHLIEMDWVKIVVGDRQDFDNSIKVMEKIKKLGCRARFALSPIHGELPAKVLAGWILDAGLWDVTLNLQIHKFMRIE